MNNLFSHRRHGPLLAICLTLASPAAHALQPATQGKPMVEKVTLQANTPAKMVTLKNVSNSKFAEDANIQPESDMLSIPLTGTVKCIQDKNVHFEKGHAYFGPASMNNGAVDGSQALFSAPYDPASITWHGAFGGGWITEGGNGNNFDVPLAAVKSGHPAIRFDPVAEFNKRLQEHINEGGTAVDFLRQDHEYIIGRTISLGGWCKGDYSGGKTGSALIGLKITYKGDPELMAKPQLNASLGNMPQDINAGEMPLQLTQVKFQPNMPHYINKCPPQADPKIRFTYKGMGKGKVRFMVKDNSSSVYGTQDIYFNGSQGEQYVDFHYPLIGKLASRPDWNTLNQTFSHPLSITAKVKDDKTGEWSEWKEYTQAIWKHRCTPSLNVSPMGGINGYDNGMPSLGNAGKINAGQQQNTTPRPGMKYLDAPRRPATSDRPASSQQPAR